MYTMWRTSQTQVAKYSSERNMFGTDFSQNKENVVWCAYYTFSICLSLYKQLHKFAGWAAMGLPSDRPWRLCLNLLDTSYTYDITCCCPSVQEANGTHDTPDLNPAAKLPVKDSLLLELFSSFHREWLLGTEDFPLHTNYVNYAQPFFIPSCSHDLYNLSLCLCVPKPWKSSL
jgi:hypothetical protein